MEQRECTYNFHDRDVFTLFEIEGDFVTFSKAPVTRRFKISLW